ncbi:O-antigen ligase family protein [Clostridium sp. 19966]|uniref:O-antigen ligase family protein n=1 Tax=Clostridium sp. 19966 TaxID=2768166 RepID=UPI0028DE1DA9|nr:O-antigen ligase family protein [Clostridium sp. 19966]MDT8716165.1 O-antigen ligase family protein [Clostridium sp. 19966]
MKKNDFIMTTLISIYVLFLAIVPNGKIEWILNLVLLLMGMIYLLELVIDKEIRKNFLDNYKSIMCEFFTILFTIFIILMILTSFLSTDRIVSFKETSRYIIYYFTYFIIRFRINKSYMHETIIKVYYISVTLVCLIGMYKFFDQSNLLQSIKYALSNSNSLNTSRVSSTLQYPNTFAAYLILAIFPVILEAAYSKGKYKIIFMLLTLLITVNLALTFSRNGLLAFAIGILIISMVYNWKFVFLYTIPIVYISISPTLMSRIKQIINIGYNQGRMNLWRLAEKMINEHFFWGVGSGNFIKMYSQYIKKYPQFKWYDTQPLPPHNSYIRAFVEMGIFTAVVFLIMCFDMLKAVYYAKDKATGITKNFFNGFLISTTCFLMMNCFDDLFYVPKVTMTFFIFVFVAYSMGVGKSKNKITNMNN